MIDGPHPPQDPSAAGPPPGDPSTGAPAEEASVTAAPFRYAGASQLVSEAGGPRLALFGNLLRDPVALDGTLRDPLRIREALAALYAVVGSDYRYIPKDRSAYHAFRRMRRESANLNAWQAQRAYFEWIARNDPRAFCLLDPVISVHPDQVFFEVFSKDEGTYANLAIDLAAFDLAEKPVCGTTNIDFSEQLYDSVQRFRSYRHTRFTIGQQAVQVATQGEKEVLEKQVLIPDSWLRGFLQVQSAAMLPTDTFKLAAIDLYNVLRHLRMHADKKGQRRGLRVELIPGQRPRLVLEPWETVLETNAAVFQGRQAKVVRIWGRRRLMLLKRMLPYVSEVEVHLIGSGLPSFWVLRGGPLTFTFGLTGFTAANWSQAVSFDLLLPRKTQTTKPLESIVKHLSKTWSDDRAGLAKAVKLEGAALVEPLQLGCQHGQIMYDLARDRFRLRPLTSTPLNLERLEFRNSRERLAFDLVHRKGAVSIVTENRIVGTGLELVGKAVVAEDKREYRPQMLITDEGMVSRAECTCNAFRQQGLKAGPCTCLVALRLTHAMRERSRASGDPRTISIETRTFSKRLPEHEQVYQVSLDRYRLKIRWGVTGQPFRVQQFEFASVDAARDEYLGRVRDLAQRGFLDAST